jgi:hypothetical protein
MVTCNGPSHLNEFMATLNSPGLSQPSISAIETDIGKWWHDVLLADMLAAGQEERRLRDGPLHVTIQHEHLCQNVLTLEPSDYYKS